MPTDTSFLIWDNFWDQLFFNTMGVLVCLYSLHIELNKEKNPKYTAMCDFNEHMSCSKVLTSKYAHGFGIAKWMLGENHILNARNCNLGLVMYCAQLAIICFVPDRIASTVLYYSAAMAVVGCLYLAFILTFVLKDFCLVCVTTYVINGCLLYLSYQRKTFLSHF